MTIRGGTYNNTKPAQVGAAIYNLITAMVAAGFTIKASGDGLAAYSATGSVFTAASPHLSGANGWNNASAWCRIKYPTGTREIMFVRGPTQERYAVFAISPSAGFITGGSATVPPSASDQVFVLGTSFTSDYRLFGDALADGSSYVNAICDDTAPYNFWLAGWLQGVNGQDQGGLFSDYASNVSSGSGGTDPDPYIYGGGSSVFGGGSFYYDYAWTFFNGSWIRVQSMFSDQQASGSAASNPYTGGHDLLPAPIFIQNGGVATSGFKGFTQHLVLNYFWGSVTNHTALNVGGGTANKIQVLRYALPWDGSTVVNT